MIKLKNEDGWMMMMGMEWMEEDEIAYYVLTAASPFLKSRGRKVTFT